jgi:tRNA dimethylallyltransferase
MAELLQKPRYVYFPYAPIKIALVPGDRAVLHERIEQRFRAMLDGGLIDEVARVRDDYGLDAAMPSMRCVGYRQVLQYLDGNVERDDLVNQGVAATRQLAKRQLTWLRAMNDVTLFDCLADDLAERVLDYVRRELARLGAAL